MTLPWAIIRKSGAAISSDTRSQQMLEPYDGIPTYLCGVKPRPTANLTPSASRLGRRPATSTHKTPPFRISFVTEFGLPDRIPAASDFRPESSKRSKGNSCPPTPASRTDNGGHTMPVPYGPTKPPVPASTAGGQDCPPYLDHPVTTGSH